MWKKWEGRVVDKRFPLRQWLGGSDHSDVFLTEYGESGAQKAVIKLIPADRGSQKNRSEEATLSGWSEAKKLSNPHLLRLLAWGRWQIDDRPLLYVVMEYAEENLGEILPLRALSGEEAQEVLEPAAKALATLHRAGFVHGRVKPSNVMAVGEKLKISTDGLGKAGELVKVGSAYDAPEVAATGLSPAADIWSLGATLLAVLTQKEPTITGASIVVPETIPQPVRETVRRCLQTDPQQRCTLDEILRELEPSAVQPQVAVAVEPVLRADVPPERPKRWMVVPIVVTVLFVVALIAGRLIQHQRATPVAESQPANVPPAAPTPVAPLPAAPVATTGTAAPRANSRGSVQQQVMPGVSQSALRTIQGTVKVNIRLDVDSSGRVSQVKLTSPESSKYFANLALAAARRWKFNPPQVDGRARGSTWTLRFRFRRSAVDVSSEEEKP
jgi:TonB family protein